MPFLETELRRLVVESDIWGRCSVLNVLQSLLTTSWHRRMLVTRDGLTSAFVPCACTLALGMAIPISFFIYPQIIREYIGHLSVVV
jgi:hypothetical protein